MGHAGREAGGVVRVWKGLGLGVCWVVLGRGTWSERMCLTARGACT